MGPTSVRSAPPLTNNFMARGERNHLLQLRSQHYHRPRRHMSAIARCIETILEATDAFIISSRNVEINLADRRKFRRIGFRSCGQIVCHSQRPSCVAQHVLHRYTGMHGSQISLAVIAKAKHAHCGDNCRRTRAQWQPLLAPPAMPVPFPGEVVCPTRETRRWQLCSSKTTVRCERLAISQAPPEPGNLTCCPLRLPHVVLRLPKRSTSAAPRKPTFTRPCCNSDITRACHHNKSHSANWKDRPWYRAIPARVCPGSRHFRKAR